MTTVSPTMILLRPLVLLSTESTTYSLAKTFLWSLVRQLQIQVDGLQYKLIEEKYKCISRKKNWSLLCNGKAVG